MILAGFFRLRILAKSQERHETAYNAAAALASEACSAIQTVAVLGKEQEFLGRTWLQFHVKFATIQECCTGGCQYAQYRFVLDKSHRLANG